MWKLETEFTTYHINATQNVIITKLKLLTVSDTNIYTATKFYVCLDREVVLTTNTSSDAILGLIQTAFIFDAHYPKELKLTFEFIER